MWGVFMFRSSSVLALCAASSLALLSAAVAQTPGVIGTVSTITGPAGSVLVVRGSQTYSLNLGDTLFEGDQIFTRTVGAVQIQTPGCVKDITSASSIVMSAAFCNVQPVTLASSQVVGGVQIGAATGGVIGATPTLLTLAGVGAAAAAANDTASP